MNALIDAVERASRPVRTMGPRRGWMLAGWVIAGLFCAAAASAQETRAHNIIWAHASPSSVSRFVILISPVEGAVAQARQIDVGLPATSGQQAGTNFYTALVNFSEDEYLAVAAVGHDGSISVPSSWSGMPPSQPGQPVLAQP